MSKIRHYENLHIPLWLLKDICWMFEWKIMGIFMIIPTISVAIYITWNLFKNGDDEYLINMAICLWISANSYWMICEFSGHEEKKNFAAIPFLAGLVCVAFFYLKRMLGKSGKNILD